MAVETLWRCTSRKSSGRKLKLGKLVRKAANRKEKEKAVKVEKEKAERAERMAEKALASQSQAMTRVKVKARKAGKVKAKVERAKVKEKEVVVAEDADAAEAEAEAVDAAGADGIASMPLKTTTVMAQSSKTRINQLAQVKVIGMGNQLASTKLVSVCSFRIQARTLSYRLLAATRMSPKELIPVPRKRMPMSRARCRMAQPSLVVVLRIRHLPAQLRFSF